MIKTPARRRHSVLFIILAVAVALAFTACTRGGSGNVHIGDELPSFYLKTPDGKGISSDDLKGQPYVLSVFATWCPPCKSELTHFQSDIWEPLKDSGVQVIAINYGDEDGDQIQQFANENNITFPLLIDTEGEFRRATGVRGIPKSFVVGKDGKVTSVYEGYNPSAVQEIKDQLTR